MQESEFDVSAAEASHWLASNSYLEAVQDRYTAVFMVEPCRVPHMLIAMICIARCAESEQNLENVYLAVRNWEYVISPTSLNLPGMGTKGVLKEIGIAREAGSE